MNFVCAANDTSYDLLLENNEQNVEILQKNYNGQNLLKDDLDDEYDPFWNCSEDDNNYTNQINDDSLSDDEINQYISNIKNTSSKEYFSFINYLINDKGYEFRIDSKIDDGYIIYSTHEYNWILYSGENYTTQINETYFIKTQEREGYILDNNYYPDIIYYQDGNYFLDEDYFNWLKLINCSSIIKLGNISIEYENVNKKSPSRILNKPLPSRYDYRDFGWVTPVKTQKTNDCWAFASIAALESYLLKNYGESYNFSTNLDFSEKNLRNVMSSKGKQGTNYTIDQGNNLLAAIAYFIRWSGPINEVDDLYDTNPNSLENITPVKHVQGIKILPLMNNYTIDDIKYSVYQYGGVVVSLVWNSSYVNKEESSYIYPYYDKNARKLMGHAVTIIGWDDNYSMSNFKVSNNNMGDGAFIVKNSYGNESGDGGYYYVSYYDATLCKKGEIGGFVFTSVENNTNYGSNYHYTPLGLNHEELFFGSKLSFYNQWTASKDENLKACGLYVKNSVQCHINVLVNDESKLYMVKNLDYAGYHTIDFDKIIHIKKNQRFKIEITLINRINSNFYFLELEYPLSNYPNVYSMVNESFVYIENEGWVDVSKKFENSNICLNAYTEYVESIDTKWIVNNFICDYGSGDYLVAKLVDKFGNPICNKNITFSGKGHIHQKMTDSEGKAYLQINLNPGSYIYCVDYSGEENYRQTNKYVIVQVNKVTPTMITNNNCYFGESLDVTLKYGNSMLKNKKVIIKTTSNTFNRTTNNEGKASLVIHLVNNSYCLKILFLGDKIFNPVNKTINFTVSQPQSKLIVTKYSTSYNSGKYFKFKILNSISNKTISGVKVTIKFIKSGISKSYTINTDTNGIAKLHISKFELGTYSVEITTDKRYTIMNTVKTTATILKASTSIIVPKVTNKYKSTQYFKVTVKHSTTGKTISSLKLNLKIHTGSSTKTYQITTNCKGIASFNTNSLAIGTHNVDITSPNTKYNLSKTSSITIKK